MLHIIQLICADGWRCHFAGNGGGLDVELSTQSQDGVCCSFRVSCDGTPEGLVRAICRRAGQHPRTDGFARLRRNGSISPSLRATLENAEWRVRRISGLADMLRTA